MPNFRRATAIVAQALMLQFILLGSGVVCARADPGHRETTAKATMSAIGVMAMAGPERGSHGSHSRGMPGCPGSADAPCEVPGIPSACAGMALCASVAAVPPAVTLLVAARPHPQGTRPALLPPPFRTVAPELPPPRA